MRDWNWEALGTWFIGVVATVIAWKQFKIEKYKKDDFLFQHKYNAYIELANNLYLFIVAMNKESDSTKKFQFFASLKASSYGFKLLFQSPENKKVIESLMDEALELYNNTIMLQKSNLTVNKRQEISEKKSKNENVLKEYLEANIIEEIVMKSLNLKI